jgi:4-amino-4-deoxy-L-arabinose transferase-like glycosyltransferase
MTNQFPQNPLGTKISQTKAHLLLLSILTAVLLAPFLNKAFNFDDPLFIWMAKQIHLHPLDPYGFSLNWYGFKMWAWDVIQNPPGVSYYIALAARCLNWSEMALHMSFYMSGLGVVLGTYFLARRVCSKPLLAGLLVLTMPVFLVSSTTVMSDITMLAFFIWAILFWVRGLDANHGLSLLASAFLIVLCILTKYFGIFLIPVLVMYTLIKKRSAGLVAMVYLLIPVLALFWYYFKTLQLYGVSLLLNAATYAGEYSGSYGFKMLEKLLIGLSFTGGCSITMLFFSRFLLKKADLIVSFIFFVLAVCSALYVKKTGLYSFDAFSGLGLLPVLHLCLFIFTGIIMVSVSTRIVWNNRDDHVFLLLHFWMVSTFIFAVFLNWTVNGRSLLPLVPPFCILAARQIDVFPDFDTIKYRLLPSIVAGMLFSFMIAGADCRLADSSREAANAIFRKYGGNINKVYFQGHWGFQYYMEEKGFKALDIKKTALGPGDIVVNPDNNSNVYMPFSNNLVKSDKMEFPVVPWITTMNVHCSAGFYTSVWGPLPFVIGAVPAESYYIYSLK